MLKLYEAGSEGPQWWADAADPVRGLPPGGILDRCSATHTCPKIIEHFGAAEVWGLKLTPEWVGSAGDKDLPLPDNVRRYYIPSTQHGGGRGGFSTAATAAPACPTVGWGKGALRRQSDAAHRDGQCDPGAFPQLGDEGYRPAAEPLSDAGGRDAGGCHQRSHGLPVAAGPAGARAERTDQSRPRLRFRPRLQYIDGTGVQTMVPPRIKHVINLKVPRVDADGNELGGVPVVLRDAPLGTYLGWNITAAGFHKGQICNYAGGMIPFAKTKAERLAAADPRPSLEERYGNHAGYVAAVDKAARNAVASGFLLETDAKRLVAAADAGDVLK